MLAMITALSLSACGTTTESTGTSSEENSDVQITTKPADTEQAAPADSTTSAVTEATEQTTTATTAPEESETPVELPVLNVEPALVMNGCMAFKCDGKNYVYNITENEMYETEYDVDDITVLKGYVAIVGYAYSDYGLNGTEAYIVNLKTGESYDEIRPFYNYNWNGAYLTVGKLEESFSGNTVSIGILNDKGEWVLPLSADYPVCKEKDISVVPSVDQNSTIISFNGYPEYNYDITHDKIIENTDVYDITDDKVILREYDEYGTTASLYYYDVSTNEQIFIGSNLLINQYGNLLYSDDYSKIYDNNYNLLNYNLSEYKIWDKDKAMKGATDDVIVFNASGKNGNAYTIVLNKDGNYVCEPIEVSGKNELNYKVYFSENKIIFISNKITDRIIDINTGEVTECDNSFEIVDYDDENNLMLVNTNGAYYLVDPEAPDVLINPFERASN